MKKLKDVMTRNVITVTEETPVVDALSLLIGSRISGIPVVTDAQVPIGIVSEKDLLKFVLDENVKDFKGWVSDHMTRDVVCFDEEDDVSEVCKFLMDKPFRRVPIVSNDKLVGIISRRDLLKYILIIRTMEGMSE
jgi:CBS domain-containing protein